MLLSILWKIIQMQENNFLVRELKSILRLCYVRT